MAEILITENDYGKNNLLYLKYCLNEIFIRTGAVITEKENGRKFETLAVDLVKLLGSVLPYEVAREKEFAPIKNKTGVDSVESARELLKLNGVEL